MKVYYDRDNATFDVRSKTVKDMLKEINVFRNAVIVVVNNEVVTEEYEFQDNDTVKILSVVSGG